MAKNNISGIGSGEGIWYVCTYVVHMHPGISNFFTLHICMHINFLFRFRWESSQQRLVKHAKKKKKTKTNEEETQYSPNTSGVGVVFTCMAGHCEHANVFPCACSL